MFHPIPYSAERIHKLVRTKNARFWQRAGEERALALFHEMAQRVPAYKDFLRTHKIRSEKITTIEDFKHVPPINKKNYLRNYTVAQMCWDGTAQDKDLIFTATSGSTGEPVYFPRNEALDFQASILYELFLKNMNGGKIPSTLVIDAFGMGIWIGGLITYQAFRMIALRGHPISIITPGPNKKEIFSAIRRLHTHFDQILMCGYPPFIKDIIDEGAGEGVKWEEMNLRILCAAETFTDEFRNYIIRTTKIKNPYTDMMNIYGSADLGAMAQETPLSIFTRTEAHTHEKLWHQLFPGVNRTPTLAQFNPLFIYFEAPEQKILCTGYNALPLVRYEIGDHGGVFEYDSIVDTVKIDSIEGVKPFPWPFVYVYERIDLSTTLYGINIYPEYVRRAILDREFEKFLTGKFTMQTKYDKKNDQYLEINMEMKSNVRPPERLKTEIRNKVVRQFLEKSSEYPYLVSMMGQAKANPRINLLGYEDGRYFKREGKQKWVLK